MGKTRDAAMTSFLPYLGRVLPASPIVDVILPTNRTSPYLQATIASLAAQTWTHWRLILVDDGVPDPEYLDAAVGHVRDSRVIHRPHAGVSAARNAGLAAATGDLIAFVDDDDLWEPRRLEAQVAALRTDPEALGAFCGGYFIDDEGRRFGNGWTAEQVAPERMIDGSVPAPRIVTLLLTRDACRRVGPFDETLVLAEDNDFILRVLQQGSLVAVPEQLVGYRRHEANTSDQALTEGRRATDRLLAKQIKAARRRGDDPTAALLRRHLRRHHERSAEASAAVLAWAIRSRRGSCFVRELSWALRHAPWFTAAAVVRRCVDVVRRRRLGTGRARAPRGRP